ncbi:hypothetical protein [Brochothrix thermosphacta]|uniref:hypothetical protein n=1 Tax=Brochothrix thermosphacta TaxID=2756 RepID=UPI00083F6960|nr:hypothetical protein [Brochothrix thermosphacta]ODJ57426.1 hypothetical protein BFR41_02495 [Brochothrix thermosphacta]ODJ72228.1 hypothetical protein BFR43_00670 [Brochothrix thermosphacta]
MNKSKLSKAKRRYLEEEIRYFHTSKRELQRLRRDIMQGAVYQSADDNAWIGSGSSCIQEPERRTIALLENRRIQRLESIVQAIEEVFQMLTKEQQTLVKYVFWTHPQTLTMEGIAQQMHLSRRTFYRKKDEVLMLVGGKLGYL